MRDLKSTLYFTVHGADKSVEQLADEMGISASYLYRACLEGESGCRFPLDLILPLMQATGDYRVLEHLNARSGRVTTSLGRVGKLKKKDPQVVNEIQKNFNAAMGMVLEFFAAPDRAKVQEITHSLQKHLCEVAALKRTVGEFHQGDLF